MAPAVIADDYELSNPRLAPLCAGSPAAHRVGPGRAEPPARRHTTARAVILATLEALDVEAVLRARRAQRSPAARGS